MEKLLVYFLSCLFLTPAVVIIGMYLFGKRFKIKSIKNIIAIVLFMILLVFNYMYVIDLLKILFSYILINTLYHCLFNEELSKTILASFLAYLIILFGELVYVFILSAIMEISGTIPIPELQGSIISNVCVCIIALIIMFAFGKKLSKLVSHFSKMHIVIVTITSILCLLGIASLFYYIALNDWHFDYGLILSLVAIIGFGVITLIVIKERIAFENINYNYEQLSFYARSNEQLVEEYRIAQHENKNELAVIRSMVGKNNKKLIDYLDTLVKEKKDLKYAWINKLGYFPFSGLKGLIQFKLIKAEELGITIDINISKNISKSSLSRLSTKENIDLSKLIGIYLDNAIEATSLADDKQLMLDAYVENDKVIIMIANTFADTNTNANYSQNGLSTKGKDRGHGLILAHRIIDKNSAFMAHHEINSNIYIQKLEIKKSDK